MRNFFGKMEDETIRRLGNQGLNLGIYKQVPDTFVLDSSCDMELEDLVEADVDFDDVPSTSRRLRLF